MNPRPIRMLLVLCTLTMAVRVRAEEPTERSAPLADRLENLRRNLLGEGSENTNSLRRSGMRSSAARGERALPRGRQTASEPVVDSSRQPVRSIRQSAVSAPEAELATPEAGDTSRRRDGGAAEQTNAGGGESTRRRAPQAQEEPAPEFTSESTPLPVRAEPASPAPIPTPKSAARTDAPAAGSGGVLFARKGPLLRTETIGPQTMVVGKPAGYKVRIQNLGDAPADGVIVQIQLPDWAEVVSTQPTRGTVRPPEKNQAGSVVQWQLSNVEGRGPDELDLQIVMRRSQRFNLAVTWTAAPTASEAMVEVLEPKLELSISGPRDVLFGETKSYRMTIANPGTGDAEQVSIQLMSVDGGTQPAASQTIGTIPAGQSKTLEIEFAARRAGAIKISAVATADSGLRSEATEEVLVRRAGLKIDVASPPMKYAGTPCSYTIQVSNPGDAAAQKLTVVAALPPGAQQPEPSAGAAVSSDGSKVTWKIDSLAPGQQQLLQLNATLQSPGANQLRVTAEASGDLVEHGAATTNVEALADLKLEVSDPSGPVAVGDEAIYEIRIRNRGTTAATGVEAVGFFSEGVEPVRAQGGSGRLASGQVVYQPIPSLAAGSEVVLKIAAKASTPGNHVFRAEVRCRSLGTQLVGEESTLFYQPGGGQVVPQTAQRPAQPTPLDAGAAPIR